MTWHEIRLPAGDVSGFDIDYESGTGQRKLRSSDWLPKGHEGVRIIGQGIGRTHMFPGGWNGCTLLVGRHRGTVRLENLTFHAGYDRGTLFGLPSREKPEPKFRLELFGVQALVDPPRDGRSRTKWLLFGYNSDVVLDDCELDATEAREHASYWHGFARSGLRWTRVHVRGSGAEGLKVRSDMTETEWAGSRQSIIVESCTFKNWFQTWSDRGGAAIVLQGSQANLVVERSTFWGGGDLGWVNAASRSKCIMVSSEADSYDAGTGKVGVGVGNGHVVVRDCALRGGPGTENYTTILRVGRNGGQQLAAKSVLVERCGIWGQRMSLQLNQVQGSVIVRECNTPAVRDYCEALGMDTRYEAGIPTRSRVVPVSEGYGQ